jgi:hypothetical protein
VRWIELDRLAAEAGDEELDGWRQFDGRYKARRFGARSAAT